MLWAAVMLEGITAGFILSLSLFPGTVWLARVGAAGGGRQVLAVGTAFALSQLLWLLVAVPGLMLMMVHLAAIEKGMHGFAAFVLFYMALKFVRTRRAETLECGAPLPDAATLFRSAFKRAFAMPMRLPAAMAILMATGVYVTRPPDPERLPAVLAGVFLGVAWWWGQFTFLSALFAKRVPAGITLKSLNKIRPFCAALFFGLAGLTLFWAGG